MKKFSLLSALLFITLSVGCFDSTPQWMTDVNAKTHVAVTPADRADVAWWMPRHEGKLAAKNAEQINIVFIGDSITHGFENKGKEMWEKYYAPRGALNLGFSGDRTEHVLWRIDHGELDGISPKLAVLMIGTNNSGRDDAETIADGIKAIVARIRGKLPETKILILSIFPRVAPAQREAPENQHGTGMNEIRAKNDAASQFASKIADNKMIFFLDINKAFLNDEGILLRDVMPDLLHPNEKGYQLWAEALEPAIKKLMKD